MPGEAGEVEGADEQPVGVARQPAQQRHVQQRRVARRDRVLLPPEERPHQRREGQRDDQRPPRTALEADQRVEHRDDRQPQQQRARDVDAGVLDRVATAGVVRDEAPHGDQRDEADGDVDQEERPPAVLLAEHRDQQPADQRPGGGGDRHREAEHPEGPTALVTPEQLLDQPGVLRRQQPGARALRQPGDDDRGGVGGEARGGAGDDEADEPDHHHPAASVRVAEAPAGDERHAEGQRVARDHPLHRPGRRLQPGADRRHRDVDDGDVQQRHEADEQGHRQDPPPPGIGDVLLLGRDGVGLLVLGHARHLLTAPKRSSEQDHKHD